MYKVLIADDEEIIRRGLAKLMGKDSDWEVVGQAEDGEMALEVAVRTLPDLLLVDLNMPFLGGLEFIERLKDVLTGAVIIVITGYDDFNFAQQALRLGVFDYLLKPVTEDAFFEALQRAKAQLSSNRQQVKYLEWARMQVRQNHAALTAAFLDDWLGGRCSDTEAFDQLEYLGLSVPSPFGVSVVHLSTDESRGSFQEGWDETLLYYAAENIAREVFEPFAPVTTCKNACGDLVLLSGCEPSGEWHAAAGQLMELLERHLPVQTALCQARGETIHALPEAYDAAMEELDRQEKCPQAVVEARRYIEAHYADVGLSLQEVAEHLHLSPQYMSRLFRHEGGITFVDYMTRVRIRRAVELLSQGNLKMYEIAERTGYASQHYFSNAFKKVLGVSPLEYRRGANSG